MQLSARQAERVVQLVIQELKTVPLVAPLPNETEYAYTKRCLSGQLRITVERLGLRGLVVAGAGVNPVRPVNLFRLNFYPDLAIFYYRSRVLAVEVKYVGRGQRENSVATALGQAMVYQCGGYPLTAVLLVDLTAAMTDFDIRNASKACAAYGAEVIVRRRVGTLLSQHPS